MADDLDDPLHVPCDGSVEWTTVNYSEAMPGVLTPLGWTFWHPAMELGIRTGLCRLGVYPRSFVASYPPLERRTSNIFYGRVAANVNEMRRLAASIPGASVTDVERHVFGLAREGVTEFRQIGRYPAVAAKAPIAVLSTARRTRVARETASAFWSATTTAPPETLDAAISKLQEAQQQFAAALAAHTVASLVAQGAFEHLVKLAVAAGHPGLESTLATGYGDLAEADLVADLWKLSRERLSLDGFLAVHGHHGPDEGELSSRSWREDAAPILRMADTYRKMPDEDSPEARHRIQIRRREEAEETLRKSVPALGRPRLNAVLWMARRLLLQREVTKAAFIQVLDVARLSARAAGRRLSEASVLEQPDDVFYLTMDEVRSAAISDCLGDLVQFRRARREAYRALQLPEIWVGTPVPAQGKHERPCSGADIVTGTPVSPGAAEGIVRRIVDPADCTEPLEPGQILVCQTTDPSWAAMFMAASALVIDVGTPFSHGAIIARELGIPCVINTRVGTKQLSTGDAVRVDGGSGEVFILKRASAAAAEKLPGADFP